MFQAVFILFVSNLTYKNTSDIFSSDVNVLSYFSPYTVISNSGEERKQDNLIIHSVSIAVPWSYTDKLKIQNIKK